MSQFHGISDACLRAWAADSAALMVHPRVPAKTGRDPALPGRDWYKKNHTEICEELERRKLLR